MVSRSQLQVAKSGVLWDPVAPSGLPNEIDFSYVTKNVINIYQFQLIKRGCKKIYKINLYD